MVGMRLWYVDILGFGLMDKTLMKRLNKGSRGRHVRMRWKKTNKERMWWGAGMVRGNKEEKLN